MISSFLAIGSSTAKGPKLGLRPPRRQDQFRATTTTVALTVATTTPGGQVVFDNPRDLPSPGTPSPAEKRGARSCTARANVRAPAVFAVSQTGPAEMCISLAGVVS